MNRPIVYLLGTLLLAINAAASAMEPVAVSPGSDNGGLVVGETCPTFSWSRMDGAVSYQVAVFEAVAAGYVPTHGDMAALAPVIDVEIEAPALTWTPSSGQCLGTGLGYVWYVKGIDAAGMETWSAGKGFTVDLAATGGIQEAVEGTVNEYLTNEWSGTESYLQVKEGIKAEVIKETGVSGQGSISILGSEGDAQDNTYYGTRAGASLDGHGLYNAFFGVNAGNGTTGGDFNTFVGNNAGYSNTTGSDNTFIGRSAGYYSTTGINNTFIGRLAGYYNTTGYDNTFIGRSAGISNTTGSDNTFIGRDAGISNTIGNYNTFIGRDAGFINTTGINNTFIGWVAGYYNGTGNYNTFIGRVAGYNNTTGNYNTFIGMGAGQINTIGGGNVFLGHEAGYNETGSYRLYIDNSRTAVPLIYGEFDNDLVRINGNLEVKRSDGSAKILVEETNASVEGRTLFELKNAGSTKFIINNTNAGVEWAFTNSGTDFRISRLGTGVVEMALDNSGNMTIQGNMTELSSRAAKHDIEAIDAAAVLNKVLALPIARWRYRDDTQGARHLGPMAEDFAAAFGLGATNKGISTLDTSGVALAAIQGLNQKLSERDSEIDALKKANASLKKEKDAEITALKQENDRQIQQFSQISQRLEQLERLLLSEKVALR